MFDFSRKISEGLRKSAEYLDERKVQKAEERQARQERAERELDEWTKDNLYNGQIATYFNQMFRDNPGYEMSVRRKGVAGSEPVRETRLVSPPMIAQIKSDPNLFLEGHVRTEAGLIKDVFDGAHPEAIRRERYGNKTLLAVTKIEDYEKARRAAKPDIGPHSRVIWELDPADIPIKGMTREEMRRIDAEREAGGLGE